jgi:hypothetical protein
MNASGLSPKVPDLAARLTMLSVQQGEKVRHVVTLLRQGRRDEARAFIHQEETKGLG